MMILGQPDNRMPKNEVKSLPHTADKHEFKVNQNLNVKVKTIILLKENPEFNIYSCEFGKHILNFDTINMNNRRKDD